MVLCGFVFARGFVLGCGDDCARGLPKLETDVSESSASDEKGLLLIEVSSGGLKNVEDRFGRPQFVQDQDTLSMDGSFIFS